MRLRVQHDDGRIEILTLVPPVEAVPGENMNRLACGDGTDFFFTLEGYYDGWGRNQAGVTKEEADADVERMQAGREIEEQTEGKR